MFPTFASAQVLVDFDELTPPDQGNGDFFFDGYGSSASAGVWISRDTEFNTNQFGPGWSYSSVNDTTTAGFTNQWAAITGSDLSGSGNYALATSSLVPNGAFVNLPAGLEAESIFVTNTTFAFLSMLNGDAFAKQFGGMTGNDPDFFKVIFTGFSEADATGNETGSVEFLLADFRFADNSLDFIVDQWESVDLSLIGSAKSVRSSARSFGISFESSDVGDFGINTPVYVAVDSLQLQPTNVSGDVNQDGVVDLLDVQPFVELLETGGFQSQADVNHDGAVDLLDVAPFVDLLHG